MFLSGISITDVIAGSGLLLALFSTAISYLVKINSTNAADEEKIKQLKEEVNQMVVNFDSIKMTVLDFDKKLETSIVHQQYHKKQVQALSDKFEKNSEKLDKILEHVLKSNN